MTFGSLFAGTGGFDLGLEAAGFQCVWQVEIEGYALERLELRFPEAARLTTIAEECGVHAKWGTRPPSVKGLVPVESGPLCSSCDRHGVALQAFNGRDAAAELADIAQESRRGIILCRVAERIAS